MDLEASRVFLPATIIFRIIIHKSNLEFLGALPGRSLEISDALGLDDNSTRRAKGAFAALASTALLLALLELIDK